MRPPLNKCARRQNYPTVFVSDRAIFSDASLLGLPGKMNILQDGLNRSRSHGCNISPGRNAKKFTRRSGRDAARYVRCGRPSDQADLTYCILVLKTTDPLLDLADIIPNVIDRAADTAKVLKNDVVRLGHAVRLSQLPIIVSYGGQPDWTVRRGHHAKPEMRRQCSSQRSTSRMIRTGDYHG